MPVVAQRRDGLYSIAKYARILCRLLNDFAPVIERLYPNNSALRAALAAALTACSVLVGEVEAQRQQGV